MDVSHRTSISGGHVSRSIALPAHLRRIVTASKRTFHGYVPSAKPGNKYRLVGYESILERDFIQLVEDDKAVVRYDEQPGLFKWRNGINTYKYHPDFALFLDSGRRICVEIKPYSKMRDPLLVEAYEMIGEQIVSSGRFEAFQIWTDREIRDPVRLLNAEIRNSERRPYVDFDSDLAAQQALRDCGGRASVRRLRELSGLGAGAFRTIVRLIALGRISCVDATCLIEDGTIVEIS